MTLITSPTNSRIKQIRALQQRRERERSGLFFVEGLRAVAEAVQLGHLISMLVVAPQLMVSALAWELYAQLQAADVPILEVSSDVFETLAAKEVAQGVGAVVAQRWEPLEELSAGDATWIALDAVQYPGNLGTILRTADASGAAGVILLGHATDPYDPACVRASLGALLGQRLVRADFARLLRWKRQQNIRLVGTSPDATADYRDVAYGAPLVLLMGSERQGLAPAQQAACDDLVRIPMTGRVDSLNLAVATALVLYEAFHQQRRAA